MLSVLSVLCRSRRLRSYAGTPHPRTPRSRWSTWRPHRWAWCWCCARRLRWLRRLRRLRRVQISGMLPSSGWIGISSIDIIPCVEVFRVIRNPTLWKWSRIWIGSPTCSRRRSCNCSRLLVGLLLWLRLCLCVCRSSSPSPSTRTRTHTCTCTGTGTGTNTRSKMWICFDRVCPSCRTSRIRCPGINIIPCLELLAILSYPAVRKRSCVGIGALARVGGWV